MADAGDDTIRDPTQYESALSQYDQTIEKFSLVNQKLDDSLSMLQTMSQKYPGVALIESTTQNLKGVLSIADKTKGKIEDLAKASGKKIDSSGLTGFATKAESIWGSIKVAAANAFQSLTKQSGAFNDLLGSGSVLATVKMKKGLMEVVDAGTGGMLTLQKELMAFNKTAMQAGLAFGLSFETAEKDADEFRKSFVGSTLLLYATKEELQSVQKAFKDAFQTGEQVRSLDSLKEASDNLKVKLSATNVAIAVAAATGTDSAEIAKHMAAMYTELGASTEDAAKALGSIALAADASGLGFEKVADSIVKSTQTLKMWGGTVAGVAPLFESFANSLQGRGFGRQGLTPEL
ncbi:MAG TPA: hypothetical protein ENI26_08875, partial [Methylophaga aminisulfidivorans]|nr:hypothetical protein [Methylophaga aminisulfidivorans]